MHKSGFVNIIGNPNAGKSTLMNAFIGDKLSITTPKAQTTRQRILGIKNEEDYQIVFSDTPGLVNPHYKLHETMLTSINESLHDADVFLLISDRGEDFKNADIIAKINKSETPVIVLINKIDLSNQNEIQEKITFFKEMFPEADILPVSALHKFNLDKVLEIILEKLPENPPYFPKDEISDRNVRFFVSEIIREKIMMFYKKEIPYSVEVVVESYEESAKLDKIRAVIFVERESQRGIIIGEGGKAIKKIATAARRQIEKFIDKKIFLEIVVKIQKDWRDDETSLKKFGYLNS